MLVNSPFIVAGVSNRRVTVPSLCEAPNQLYFFDECKASHKGAATDYSPLLDNGAAMCSSERRSAATPIHASIAAAKIINAAATKYPMNNALLDRVPMIQPNSSGAPTPPTNVPTAKKTAIAIPRISSGKISLMVRYAELAAAEATKKMIVHASVCVCAVRNPA